jgi:hypothetical protein
MRKLILATAAVLPLIGVSAAVAEPSCNVAKAEWQPEQALRDKLAAQKWTIKKIKVDNGCYEVYGTDDKGKKVEVYFNPKSLDALPEQEG